MDTDNQANLIDLEESTDTNSQPPNPDNAEQNKVMDIIGNGQLVKRVICDHCCWSFFSTFYYHSNDSLLIRNSPLVTLFLFIKMMKMSNRQLKVAKMGFNHNEVTWSKLI